MLLTALVQTNGGTLVVDLPRDRIDLEIKIRSIGIQKTSDQIHIVDNEDCDVSVKLFGDSDIGKHLSLLFGEDNTLLEVNKTLQTVENSIEDTNDNTRHCILALDEAGEDGILIDPQGYSYPRYSAYIPNAKQMLQMEQYPSLQAYVQDMMDVVDEVVQLAVNSQENGEFHSDLSDIENDFQPNVLDKYLLAEMLNNRPEFESAEYADGELNAVISGEHLTNGSEEEMSGITM